MSLGGGGGGGGGVFYFCSSVTNYLENVNVRVKRLEIFFESAIRVQGILQADVLDG